MNTESQDYRLSHTAQFARQGAMLRNTVDADI